MKFKTKKSLGGIIIYCLLTLSLFIPGSALAVKPYPLQPMSLYGTAAVNGQPLAAGTKIQAFNNGILIGQVAMPEAGVYGYNDPTKNQLVVGEFTGDLVFGYLPAGAGSTLTGDNVVKYTGKFYSGLSFEVNLNFVENNSTAPPKNDSGNGGGGTTGGGSTGSGGGYSPAPTRQETGTAAIEISATSSKENEVQVLGTEHTDYSGYLSLFGLPGALTDAISASEADTVSGQTISTPMKPEILAIFNKIMANIAGLTNEEKYAAMYFINTGTPTTLSLGAGERGGALNSYISAFGHFPVAAADWQDVIKIANGRWPTVESTTAVNRAQTEFKKIYLREPDMNNPNDNAAVSVIAYGLRPANRNTDSEKAAIKIFFSIYGHNPATAGEWDAIRAIAYSGAVR